MRCRWLSIVFGAVFVFLMWYVIAFKYFPGDLFFNQFFNNLRSDGMTSLMKAISDIFDPIVVLAICVVAVLFFILKISFTRGFNFSQKKEKLILVFAGLMLGGALLQYLFKIIISRARPENILVNESSFSFPSGHAVISIILFLFLIFLFNDKIRFNLRRLLFVAAGVLIVFLIGVSRIYLGAHWFSDVIGGWALGLCWFFFLFGVMDYGKRV